MPTLGHAINMPIVIHRLSTGYPQATPSNYHANSRPCKIRANFRHARSVPIVSNGVAFRGGGGGQPLVIISSTTLGTKKGHFEH